MTPVSAVAIRELDGAADDFRSPTAQLKLCHFSTAHPQLKSRTFHRMCLPLSQAGVHVTYISPASGTRWADIDPVPLRSGRNRVFRSLFNLPLLRALLAAKASLYHFQDPELLPFALALKLFFRKRLVYDAYEDFPSMAREAAWIPRALRPLASAVVKGSEALAAYLLDGILTSDPFTMSRLARVGKSRKLVFHNFPNLDFFPAPSEAPKRFDFVYRGGLSRRAGTYILLEALNQLAKAARTPRVLLIGYFDSVPAEVALREKIGQLGLASHVEIRGRIDHEQMARALSESRIGLCPLQATAKFALNLPVKIFEYWACGLPVIASDLPPIRPYFRNAHAGLLFRPGSATELATSMAWLLDRPRPARAMGRNGRRAVVERLNNRQEVRNLLRFCAALASAAAPAKSRNPRQAETCSNPS